MPEIAYDPHILDACLEDRTDYRLRHDCIGLAAARCWHGDDATTYRIARCYHAETDQWDVILSATLDQRMALDRADDAGHFPDRPRLVPALEQAQRDWLAFRESSCNYEAATWLGGTGAGPAVAACQMELTARQALWLQSYVGD